MSANQPSYSVLEANTRLYLKALHAGQWFEAHETLAAGVLWNEDYPQKKTVDILAAAIKPMASNPISEDWLRLFLETYSALKAPLSQRSLKELFQEAIYARNFDIATMLIEHGLDLTQAQTSILKANATSEYAIAIEERLSSFVHWRKNKRMEMELQQAKAEITELRDIVTQISTHIGLPLDQKPTVKPGRKPIGV